MIPVVAFLNDKITGQLKRALSNFFTISIVSEKEIEISKDAQILFFQQNNRKCSVKTDGILIFSDSSSFDSEKCSCSIAIVDSSNAKFVDLHAEIQYITCGMSGKDTITFSSIDDREVSISLLREIKDIYGNEIEPFEVLIETDENISSYTPFSLLSFVALVTILGKNISGQKLFLK